MALLLNSSFIFMLLHSVLSFESDMDTEIAAFGRVIEKFERTDYFREQARNMLYLRDEIDENWFQNWLQLRLQPILNIFAEQSSNGAEFLDQFPAEIRKWKHIVGVRAVAVRGGLPCPRNSRPDQIWEQIFTFIETKTRNNRCSILSSGDDKMLIEMCMRFINEAINPFFLTLTYNISRTAFRQDRHEQNAERIVGIIEMLGPEWVPILQDAVKDMVQTLYRMDLSNHLEIAMRERIAGYLYHIISICDCV